MLQAARRIVIVGSGMAGGVAARTLREEGYDGPITIVGDEPGVPFGRPPLSKTYLRGEEDLSHWLVEPADWYRAHDVQLIRSSVQRVDTNRRRVASDQPEAIEYSKLLIATGGRNRRLAIPGADQEGVYQLRTVADCDDIRRAARSGARALVVGMGFIGSEVAASLRQLGLEVTAVFPGRFPLGSVLGPEMGQVMAGIHADAGVELIAEETVDRFEGSGRVERAVTKGGRTIECDLVIAAVGIQPNTELVHDTDIAVDNGIIVDASCRTSAPDVFAAGDVANHLHPLFGRIRVEHYNNAEKQGAAAARSMLGSEVAYSYLHTFWSDQYEHKLEYVGHVRRWDQFVVRGSLEDRKFLGFYLEDGVLRAAVGLNRGGDPELDTDGEMAMAGGLVARRARPSPSALS
ncbi:MAG TPA: FAD-dependent oxidoreductase [Candidatus Dormibacteraeota bacterium]|nr:FAD-dependent oxidoreductase [Candidatus Dormibacteraeota bacterium]